MCCGTPAATHTNGHVVPGGFRRLTEAQCCARCVADGDCNAFTTANASTSADPNCWLLKHAKGTYHRPDRSLVFIAGRGGGGGGGGGGVDPGMGTGCKVGSGAAGDQNAVLAGWPAFRNGHAETGLNYLGWGGCQMSPGFCEVGTHIGRWTGQRPLAGATQATPLLLFDRQRRALMISPTTNFWVGIHSSTTANGPGAVQAGIKATVSAIPANFTHDTILFAGRSIDGTLTGFGNYLLSKTGKARVDPYDDFVLSHLGHWNDAGGFYYHNPSPYGNYQDALLAVKSDAEATGIPFRYSQWDDWWLYQKGGDFGMDGQGVTYWWPKPSVFPAGLSGWLGWPTSLYSSSYSAENVYRKAGKYSWKVDETLHALPVDRAFYRDIFANASAAGIKMFEQDFFCSIHYRTNLTNRDVATGQAWVDAMNGAAAEANVSLQWCMMNPVHVLAATTASEVTNGRTTRDNHPGKSRKSAGEGSTSFQTMFGAFLSISPFVAARTRRGIYSAWRPCLLEADWCLRSDVMTTNSRGSGLVLGISGMLHHAVGMWVSRDNVRQLRHHFADPLSRLFRPAAVPPRTHRLALPYLRTYAPLSMPC